MLIADYLRRMRIWNEREGRLSYSDTLRLLDEIDALRPVVEAAMGWHTTRQAIAKADETSGTAEWANQIAIAMRAHQQAADKLTEVVAVLIEEKENKANDANPNGRIGGRASEGVWSCRGRNIQSL